MVKTHFRNLSLLLLACITTGQRPFHGESGYAIRVSWLIDGTGGPSRSDAVLLIKEDRIAGIVADVPKEWSSRVLDLRGNSVIPGLVDAHGHIAMVGLGEEAEGRLVNDSNRVQWVLRSAHTALISGVTTLRDPGTYPWVLAMRSRIDSVGPDWVTAGRQLVKHAVGAYMSDMFLEFDGPTDARRRVQELARQGSVFIKLRLTRQRPLPSLEEVRAITSEAHRLGLRVAVHTDVPDDEAVHLALDGGVDSFEHNAVLRLKDPGPVWAEIAARHLVVVPGMANWEVKADCLTTPPEAVIEEPLSSKLDPTLRDALARRASEWRERFSQYVKGGFDPQSRRAQALDETRRAHAAGVVMATGPDTGGDLLPHGRLYRDAFWFAEAGLPVEEVVRIATLNGAVAAGLDRDRGSLVKGMRADIVVVRGNLLEDYHRLKDVLLVIRNGRIVYDAR